MSIVWDSAGATVTPPSSKAMTEKRRRPAPRTMSHAEIARLSDQEAFELDLPQLMNAVIVIATEGRIDVPEFKVSISVEPFNHMHPWPVYHRTGSALFVGERVLRLNTQQYNLFNAYDVMAAAGDNVAARLRAWSALVLAMKLSSNTHVVINGYIPHFRISNVQNFPANAMTRVGAMLHRAADYPDAEWAMDSGYKYYLKARR